MILSVHAVQTHPQWISTDRHVMQGYVDLIKKPQWDAGTGTLHAVSDVIENEPTRVVIALNGFSPLKIQAECATAEISIRPDNPNLADLVIEHPANARVNWSATFGE